MVMVVVVVMVGVGVTKITEDVSKRFAKAQTWLLRQIMFLALPAHPHYYFGPILQLG